MTKQELDFLIRTKGGKVDIPNLVTIILELYQELEILKIQEVPILHHVVYKRLEQLNDKIDTNSQVSIYPDKQCIQKIDVRALLEEYSSLTGYSTTCPADIERTEEIIKLIESKIC